METSVACSTVRGSCTTYLSRTDNVRAHADMIIRRNETYINISIAPVTYKVSTGRLKHTRSIYRCYVENYILRIYKISDCLKHSVE